MVYHLIINSIININTDIVLSNSYEHMNNFLEIIFCVSLKTYHCVYVLREHEHIHV
jgi:hypothetical protein